MVVRNSFLCRRVLASLSMIYVQYLKYKTDLLYTTIELNEPTKYSYEKMKQRVNATNQNDFLTRQEEYMALEFQQHHLCH